MSHRGVNAFFYALVCCAVSPTLLFSQNSAETTVVERKSPLRAESVDEPEIPRIDRKEAVPIRLPVRNQAVQDVPNEHGNAVTTIDLSSGEITNFIPKLNGLKQNHTEPGVGIGRQEIENTQSRAFSALELVNNPSAFPWTPNCKLFMDFGGSTFVCSGTLIAPRFVLAAGHCVFDHENGLGWVDSVEVIPGYSNGNEPLGSQTAFSSRISAFTAWTNDENFDFDMAIIELDRPLGGLAGWHGFGFNSSDSFYSGLTMNNAGYPAEGPFNGEEMYFRFGTFDSISTDIFLHNDASWGGQSGSSQYWLNNDNRSVHAVLSFTINNNTQTGSVRMTEGKFNAWDGLIDNATAATPDLFVMDMNVSPTFVTAGNQLSGADYYVYNNSTATWNGTVSFDIYMSTNDFISTSDTFLQTRTWTGTLAPNSGIRLNASSGLPTIPSGTTGGTYYIGGILDVADADTFNNSTSATDTAEITIIGQAPSNDNFANAFFIGAPASTTGTNVNATFESGEPQGGSGSANQSVWWTVTAPASGTMTIDTFGSNFDTILDVFTGTSVSNLTPVVGGFNDDFSGLQSLVEIEVVAGQRYEIRVSGFGSSEGSIALNIEFIAGDLLVAPSAYTVFRGIELTGALANFVGSDDVRALYNPGFTLNDTEAPVWLVFTGTAFANEFVLESSAGTPGLTYTVEAFNWDTGIYNAIGQEPESFNADSVDVFQMAIEHVDEDDSVETRVGWRQTGFTINFPWEVRVDQVGWNQF